MPLFSTYLQFDGRCDEALEFYASALGGKITALNRYGDAPPSSNMPPVPKEWVMHGSMEWEGGTLMGSDSCMEPFDGYKGFSLSISSSDLEGSKRIFDALAEGGNIKMPFGKTFFSPGFGMLTDRFGIAWLIHVEQSA